MGQPTFDDENPFLASSHEAAVVLCRTEHANLHAGLIYRDADTKSAHFLHLGWEDKLWPVWKWAKLWAVPDTEPERLNMVRALCRKVWKSFESGGKFPYGLHYGGTTFDRATGKVLLSGGAQGLSCATFILAVFKTCGIDLIDESSWPVRGDDDLKFLKDVAKGIATQETYSRIESEIANKVKRIRPEEVLGSCVLQGSEHPGVFSKVEPHALESIRAIDEEPERTKRKADRMMRNRKKAAKKTNKR